MRSSRRVAPLVGLLVLAAVAGPAGARVLAASDRAIDAAGVLTRADVPAGWKRSKQPNVGAAEYRGITGCQRLVEAIDGLREAAAHKLSPTFTDTRSPHELTSASDVVYAVRTTRQAAKLLAAFQAPAVATCLFNAAKKGGGKRSQVTVTALSNPTGTSADFVGYRVTLSGMDVSGAPVTAVLDTAVVRVGRALVGFSLNNQDAGLPEGPAIVSAVVNRLHAAGA